MEGREGMSLQGSASYYLHRGGIGGSGGSGPGQDIHGAGSGSALRSTREIHTTHVFKSLSSNPSIAVHRDVGISGIGVSSSHNYSHGMNMALVVSSGETVKKKKRGRPRKYAPDGSNMSLLGVSRLLGSVSCSEGATPAEKPRRGRPPGSGWKQRLAPLGEWMNRSAGLAFTPHVLHAGAGEDIAAKILAFAQQRPRALCILSANGSVSAVTLRQPTTAGAITYEGRFEILCLSGSYLLAQSGGPHNRTGGISISICIPDGHIIGGAVGGRLVASNPVQVVACSFINDGTGMNAKNNSESESKDEQYLLLRSAEKSLARVSPAPSHPNVSETGSRADNKKFEPEFDLMCG